MSIPSLLRQWGGPVMISGAIALMAACSWRKWPDPLIDFGRELYVPWQISSGRVLYQDILSPYGPLSPNWNALLFRVFGVSIMTLVACNFAILTGFTALLYRFFLHTCDRVTAAGTSLVFICVFAFAQYLNTGNYNFITPYSHEAVHGTVLSAGMIYLLYRFGSTGKLWQAGSSGFCLTLVHLTKPEVALAATAAALLWGLLWCLHAPASRRDKLYALGVFSGGLLSGSAAWFVYFRCHMPTAAAARALVGAWMPLVQGGLMTNIFYASGAGFDQPAAHLSQLLSACGWTVAVLALLLAFDRFIMGFESLRRAASTVLPVIVFVALLMQPEWVPWQDLGRPLPLLTLMILAAMLWLFMKAGAWRESGRYAALAAWSCFALVLLAKILLNVRLFHYGFYLAMPAALCVTAAFIWLIPTLIGGAPGRGILFRRVMIALIAAEMIIHVRLSLNVYEAKTLSVGQGSDAFLAYREEISPVGPMLSEALEVLHRHSRPQDTLVVMPEGAMINYLSRHRNPTPYLNFLPPEMNLYGETTIVNALREGHPDFLVFEARDTREFGYGYFGTQPAYGMRIMEWATANYETISILGAEPFLSGEFGIRIMRRKSYF
jgi:hypothetical protein